MTGRVHLRGQPVGPGWLEFLPVAGTRGRLRSAAIQPDGRFRAERIPVGRVAIRLVGLPRIRTGDRTIDAFVIQARRSHEIIRQIPARSTRPIDIDLATEAAALNRRY